MRIEWKNRELTEGPCLYVDGHHRGCIFGSWGSWIAQMSNGAKFSRPTLWGIMAQMISWERDA